MDFWWYTDEEGGMSGPHTPQKLRALYLDGQVSGESLVWNENIGEWKCLGELPALVDQLKKTPTPRPSSVKKVRSAQWFSDFKLIQPSPIPSVTSPATEMPIVHLPSHSEHSTFSSSLFSQSFSRFPYTTRDMDLESVMSPKLTMTIEQDEFDEKCPVLTPKAPRPRFGSRASTQSTPDLGHHHSLHSTVGHVRTPTAPPISADSIPDSVLRLTERSSGTILHSAVITSTEHRKGQPRGGHRSHSKKRRKISRTEDEMKHRKKKRRKHRKHRKKSKKDSRHRGRTKHRSYRSRKTSGVNGNVNGTRSTTRVGTDVDSSTRHRSRERSSKKRGFKMRSLMDRRKTIGGAGLDLDEEGILLADDLLGVGTAIKSRAMNTSLAAKGHSVIDHDKMMDGITSGEPSSMLASMNSASTSALTIGRRSIGATTEISGGGVNNNKKGGSSSSKFRRRAAKKSPDRLRPKLEKYGRKTVSLKVLLPKQEKRDLLSEFEKSPTSAAAAALRITKRASGDGYSMASDLGTVASSTLRRPSMSSPWDSHDSDSTSGRGSSSSSDDYGSGSESTRSRSLSRTHSSSSSSSTNSTSSLSDGIVGGSSASRGRGRRQSRSRSRSRRSPAIRGRSAGPSSRYRTAVIVDRPTCSEGSSSDGARTPRMKGLSPIPSGMERSKTGPDPRLLESHVFADDELKESVSFEVDSSPSSEISSGLLGTRVGLKYKSPLTDESFDPAEIEIDSAGEEEKYDFGVPLSSMGAGSSGGFGSGSGSTSAATAAGGGSIYHPTPGSRRVRHPHGRSHHLHRHYHRGSLARGKAGLMRVDFAGQSPDPETESEQDTPAYEAYQNTKIKAEYFGVDIGTDDDKVSLPSTVASSTTRLKIPHHQSRMKSGQSAGGDTASVSEQDDRGCYYGSDAEAMSLGFSESEDAVSISDSRGASASAAAGLAGYIGYSGDRVGGRSPARGLAGSARTSGSGVAISRLPSSGPPSIVGRSAASVSNASGMRSGGIPAAVAAASGLEVGGRDVSEFSFVHHERDEDETDGSEILIGGRMKMKFAATSEDSDTSSSSSDQMVHEAYDDGLTELEIG